MKNGTLPPDAQLKLRTAAKVGGPGTIARRRAIDAAYRYIDERYPEYLKPVEQGEDHEQ